MATNNPLIHLLSTINGGEALKSFGEELQNGITMLGIEHERTQQPIVGQMVLRVQFEVTEVKRLSDASRGVQLKVTFADMRVKEGPLEEGTPETPPKPLMTLLN